MTKNGINSIFNGTSQSDRYITHTTTWRRVKPLAAIVASGKDLDETRRKVYSLIEQNVKGSVDFRRDITKTG